MSKHTPGPWEFATPVMAGNDRIIIESYPLGSVACVSLNGAPRRQSKLDASSPDYQEQIPTMEANAMLIAAAPELLAACQTFIEWENAENNAKPYSEDSGAAFMKRAALCREAFEKARAAIAKAEGGKS